MQIFRKLAAGVAFASIALGSHASVIYSTDFNGVEQATDSSIATSFDAAAGTAMADFYLDGFGSLDGDDDYIDVFTLDVNGQIVFSGTWSLTGGGTDRILTGASGSAVVNYGDFIGVELPIDLVAGNNVVTFAYASPTEFEGTSRYGFQGLGDEGWGLGTFTVSTVPEPSPAFLLAAGLGLLAVASLRRRSAVARLRLPR